MPLVRPYLVDKGVWVAAAVYAANAISPHLPWHSAAPLLMDVFSTVAAWGFTHFTHTKLFKVISDGQ
jgi:hypothetical protein